MLRSQYCCLPSCLLLLARCCARAVYARCFMDVRWLNLTTQQSSPSDDVSPTTVSSLTDRNTEDITQSDAASPRSVTFVLTVAIAAALGCCVVGLLCIGLLFYFCRGMGWLNHASCLTFITFIVIVTNVTLKHLFAFMIARKRLLRPRYADIFRKIRIAMRCCEL